jgi:hypothetical protein
MLSAFSARQPVALAAIEVVVALPCRSLYPHVIADVTKHYGEVPVAPRS